VRTEISDQKLLNGLALNDRKAVETIYKQHYQMVQAMITNNSGNSDDARDIFQEIMIVLYEKARTGTFELNCQLKTYLYSVGRRLWLKRLAQMQRIAPDGGKMEEMVPVEEDIALYEQRNIDFGIMERAMQNIGEPCRSLLSAYYLQKKSMMEIAGSFGYTNADNAKNQKYKCLMRLKKLFHQYKNTNRDARNNHVGRD
jgi:RNA polymerase sigma factor (sigma-70 family)